MEAQDQPTGPRVYWTIGFLGLGTLSAIGAHALFPWYLAVIFAIVVVGMASACAFQFRETRNLLYLVAMLAMTALASFLDGVGVWEILSHRQNSELRGEQAQQVAIQEQLKDAERQVQASREEIATLAEQAQNMDNDGNTANDKLIPGLLAKIESKKADLANFVSKAEALSTNVVAVASSTAVTDSERHFFLQMADEHPNPAQWLIVRASIAFLLPELTLALLAWSLKGGPRTGQVRPQPVVIVPHPGGQPGQVWQAMSSPTAAFAMPQMSFAYPQEIREAAPPIPMYSSPPPRSQASPPMPVTPAPVPAPAVPTAPAVCSFPEVATAPVVERPAEPQPSPGLPLGMGQMMMMANAQSQQAAPEVPETSAAPVPASVVQFPRSEAPLVVAAESGAAAGEIPDEVMLSPGSVPEQEYTGATTDRKSITQRPDAGRERTGEVPRSQNRLDAAHPHGQPSGGPPSVLESVRHPQAHAQSHQDPGKTSPTKLAKNAAAKRSRKGGMRSRGASLAELASRLN